MIFPTDSFLIISTVNLDFSSCLPLLYLYGIQPGKRAIQGCCSDVNPLYCREWDPDHFPTCKERMAERGYTTQDVEFILAHGKVQSSEFDKLTVNWKYRFHGDDLDGGTGTVIVAIARKMSSIVITVLG